jgi:hypothetical protein
MMGSYHKYQVINHDGFFNPSLNHIPLNYILDRFYILFNFKKITTSFNQQESKHEKK